jgi:Peroxiredoxin
MVDFEVVALPETDAITEGDTAPEFTRPLVDEEFWSDQSLSALTDDGPVLLLFHPMDGTFQTTYLYNNIADHGWDTRDGLEVVGLSTSSPYEHKTLLAERGVDARVFSDPSNEVADEYGIINDLDGMSGITEPRTAAYLLDTDRTVQYAWVASQQPDFPPYDELQAAIDQLLD